VTLGTIVFLAFLVALSLRKPLERSLVLSSGGSAQPRRQFILDFSLCLAAGAAVMLYNMMVYSFPVGSGLKVILGCAMAGFFLSLDTSLARERAVIHEVLSRDEVLPPPKRLYSMTRKFSLVAITATLCVAAIIALVITGDVVWLASIEQNEISVSQAQKSVLVEVFFVMGVLMSWVMVLIISYSKNLKLLFENETSILERVTHGDLTRLVPVATNDEFGVIAGHTNTMIHGLRHRIKLITALKLAEEVQQNLLPNQPPTVPGLDIAGTSIYCDETGGDYYDYLHLQANRLGVVVADASDHGVGAALLMTTFRALLRQRAAMSGQLSRFVSDVNRELCKDVGDTGRFMTMFFLEIDTAARTLAWVRAGHEPAIVYDSTDNTFHELSGEGMALGVVEDFNFQEYEQQGWTPGSVVVLGTDGIHESQNEAGEMFGLERLRKIIHDHAAEPAEAIQNRVIDGLTAFRGKAAQEDDVTLVVVKLLQ
jgi:sigma-B regulation protein RsbU (phosphoserine phosphatase)